MRKIVTFNQFERLGCDFAFFLEKAGQPTTLHCNRKRFSSASVIKVPLLLAWQHLERNGEVNAAELCDLRREPVVYGSGFAHAMKTQELPFHDILLMMIATSDNFCTNLVIERLGLGRIREVFHDVFHFTGTDLQRKLMDYDARARGLDNWIEVDDMIGLYAYIEGLPAREREWVEGMLQNCTDNALLMRNIPRDTITFYHKTGSMEGVLHDWGYTRDCRIFLFTQGVRSEPEAFDIFGTCGEMLL